MQRPKARHSRSRSGQPCRLPAPGPTRHDHHAANRRIAHQPGGLGERACGRVGRTQASSYRRVDVLDTVYSSPSMPCPLTQSATAHHTSCVTGSPHIHVPTRVLVACRHAVEADAPRVGDTAVQSAAVQEGSTGFSTKDATEHSQSGPLTCSTLWHVLAPCHEAKPLHDTCTLRSVSILILPCLSQ